MTFGEKLREIREAAGLTQAALAQAAGIGLATVRDYEGNRRSPSLEIAQSLAKIAGVSCQTFEGCEFRHAKQRTGDESAGSKLPIGRPRKTQEPTERPPAKPGRPRKAEEPAAEEPKKQTRKKEG